MSMFPHSPAALNILSVQNTSSSDTLENGRPEIFPQAGRGAVGRGQTSPPGPQRSELEGQSSEEVIVGLEWKVERAARVG